MLQKMFCDACVRACGAPVRLCLRLGSASVRVSQCVLRVVRVRHSSKFVTSVAAHGGHVLACVNDGTVYAWGKCVFLPLLLRVCVCVSLCVHVCVSE